MAKHWREIVRQDHGLRCDQCGEPCNTQYECYGYWICVECLCSNADESRRPGWVNPMKARREAEEASAKGEKNGE